MTVLSLRGPEHLEAFLQEHSLPGQVLCFPTPTRTVQEAAQAVNAPVERIVKTLVFVARGEPLLVLVPGDLRVNYRVLARLLGLSRKKLRLARPDEVQAWTGYPVGAVPPLGLPRRFPTLLERSILDHTEVFAGGGAANALLRIPVQALVEVLQPRVVDLRSLQDGIP